MSHHWLKLWTRDRSSHQRCSMKKGILRNFTKFTGKHLAYNFMKKEILAQVFSCEFFEISKNTFFKEHLDDCFWRDRLQFLLLTWKEYELCIFWWSQGEQKSINSLKVINTFFYYTKIFTHIHNINSAFTRHYLFSMSGSKV